MERVPIEVPDYATYYNGEAVGELVPGDFLARNADGKLTKADRKEDKIIGVALTDSSQGNVTFYTVGRGDYSSPTDIHDDDF